MSSGTNVDDLLFLDDNDSGDELPSTNVTTSDSSAAILPPPPHLINPSKPQGTNGVSHMPLEMPTNIHTSQSYPSLNLLPPNSEAGMASSSSLPSSLPLSNPTPSLIPNGISPNTTPIEMHPSTHTGSSTMSNVPAVSSSDRLTSIPPSTMPRVASTTSFPNPTGQWTHQEIVRQMLIMIKQSLSKEQFARLTTELKACGNDAKKLMENIRKIAGETTFNNIMEAIGGKMRRTRSAANVAGNPNPQTVAVPPQPIAQPNMNPPFISGAFPNNAVPSSNVFSSTSTKPQVSTDRSVIGSTPQGMIMNQPPPRPVASAPARPPVIPPQAAQPQVQPQNVNAQSQIAQIDQLLKLLNHAVTCNLPAGVCTISRCEHIRRLYKHSVKCTNMRHCEFCKRLFSWVQMHAKRACKLSLSEHCPIPLCDTIRRNAAAAAAANRTTPATTTTTTNATAATTTKSPSTPQKGNAVNQFDVYGEILQLVLHAKDCKTPSCSIPRCLESRTLLEQMDLPVCPPRAKTYKQVLVHFNTCKNKATCGLCQRGLRPFDTTTETTESAVSLKDLLEVTHADLRSETDVLSYSVESIKKEEEIMLSNVQSTLSKDGRERYTTLQHLENLRFCLYPKPQLERKIKSILDFHNLQMGEHIVETTSYALEEYLKNIIQQLSLISKGRRHQQLGTWVTASAQLEQFYEKEKKEQKIQKQRIYEKLSEERKEKETNEKNKKRKKASHKGDNEHVDRQEDTHDYSIEDYAIASLRRKLPLTTKVVPKMEYTIQMDEIRYWIDTYSKDMKLRYYAEKIETDENLKRQELIQK